SAAASAWGSGHTRAHSGARAMENAEPNERAGPTTAGRPPRGRSRSAQALRHVRTGPSTTRPRARARRAPTRARRRTAVCTRADRRARCSLEARAQVTEACDRGSRVVGCEDGAHLLPADVVAQEFPRPELAAPRHLRGNP